MDFNWILTYIWVMSRSSVMTLVTGSHDDQGFGETQNCTIKSVLSHWKHVEHHSVRSRRSVLGFECCIFYKSRVYSIFECIPWRHQALIFGFLFLRSVDCVQEENVALFVTSLRETKSKARDKLFFYCKFLKAIGLISLCLISDVNSKWFSLYSQLLPFRGFSVASMWKSCI